MKKINMTKVKGIVALVIIGIVLVGSFLTVAVVTDNHEWNNGKCHKCNTQVEFVNGSYDYNTKTNRFYYRCPKCGDVTTKVFKHSEQN